MNGQLATLGTQDTGRKQTIGKTQHNMWWTLLCSKKHTNNINEPSYKQLTGGKDEPNIVSMCKS